MMVHGSKRLFSGPLALHNGARATAMTSEPPNGSPEAPLEKTRSGARAILVGGSDPTRWCPPVINGL